MMLTCFRSLSALALLTIVCVFFGGALSTC